MLSVNENFIPASEHREHAWALRTIGQDLAALRPEYLEIEFIGQIYAVRGCGRRAEGIPGNKRSGKSLGVFKRAARRTAGQGRESSWFQRKYTLGEINLLDTEALRQRKEPPFSPDIYVLGERLRTVGKMIEARNGQLVKLTLDNSRITFSYRDSESAVHQEEHSTPSLYRHQQDGHQARGSGSPRDPWLTHQARPGASSPKFRLSSEAAPGRKSRRQDDR
jgi:hypothetical protein